MERLTDAIQWKEDGIGGWAQVPVVAAGLAIAEAPGIGGVGAGGLSPWVGGKKAGAEAGAFL